MGSSGRGEDEVSRAGPLARGAETLVSLMSRHWRAADSGGAIARLLLLLARSTERKSESRSAARELRLKEFQRLASEKGEKLVG